MINWIEISGSAAYSIIFHEYIILLPTKRPLFKVSNIQSVLQLPRICIAEVTSIDPSVVVNIVLTVKQYCYPFVVLNIVMQVFSKCLSFVWERRTIFDEYLPSLVSKTFDKYLLTFAYNILVHFYSVWLCLKLLDTGLVLDFGLNADQVVISLKYFITEMNCWFSRDYSDLFQRNRKWRNFAWNCCSRNISDIEDKKCSMCRNIHIFHVLVFT